MNLTQLKGYFRQKIKVVAGGPANQTRGVGMLAVLDALAEEIKNGGSYQALTLTAAQALPAGDPPGVVPGTLYGITGRWNATTTNSTVYVHGVTLTAFHRLGIVYDAQGVGQLVQVDVAAGTYKTGLYDDSGIYTYARNLSDRVDLVARNVIRWDRERRVDLAAPGDIPTVYGPLQNAFALTAPSALQSALRVFSLSPQDYPRKGDLVAVRVLVGSESIELKGLHYGSATGPTTFTVVAGAQYVLHACATDPTSNIADYWQVHSQPSTGGGTGSGTSVPFGPLTATGAAGETFALPVGTTSVRAVHVRIANPGPGQWKVTPLFSDLLTIDTSVSPPTLALLDPDDELSPGDKMEGIAYTTGSTTTPGTGNRGYQPTYTDNAPEAGN